MERRVFHDVTGSDIREEFLRLVWQQQLFATSALHTVDGRPVTILSPGKTNHDGGPDFTDARIRVGRTIFAGDIELHTNAASWKSHKHDFDPHYNRVILHVVMTADASFTPARTASRRPIPLLVLRPFIDARLYTQLAAVDGTRRQSPIRCAPHNNALTHELIVSWIERLGTERIELKIRRFEERLKQLVDERRSVIREPYARYYGNPDDIPHPVHDYTQKDFSRPELWEQLLYEGVMEGIGYSKNREPFLMLARHMRLDRLRSHDLQDTPTMMALLFGAAGLLPSSRRIPEKESRRYVRRLRSLWKALRPLHRIPLLHEGDWLFFRLRPNNFPTARLAALCYLLPSLFGDSSFRMIISHLKNRDLASREVLSLIRRMFQFEPDAFWQTHYHFNGNAGSHGIALGPDRITDLLINTMLPVALLYARIFRESGIRAMALNLMSILPLPQSNSITRIMDHGLVKGKVSIDSVQRQQGVIQLYKYYCSAGRCAECRLGVSIGSPVTSFAASS